LIQSGPRRCFVSTFDRDARSILPFGLLLLFASDPFPREDFIRYRLCNTRSHRIELALHVDDELMKHTLWILDLLAERRDTGSHNQREL
jgi:hypothetical protein